MGFITDAVSNWFRRRGQENGQAITQQADLIEQTRAFPDPKVYEAIEPSHEDQAVKLEGPDTYEPPEFEGAREIVHTSEWRPVGRDGSYWDQIRYDVSKSDDGFWHRTTVQNATDQQDTLWQGPHATLDDAHLEAEIDVNEAVQAWTWGEPEDPIQTVHSSGWTNIDGLYEVQSHIGKSEEGWHFKTEVSREGGDDIHASWSGAYPNRSEAEQAANEDWDRRLEPIEAGAQAREDAEIAAVEREMAVAMVDHGPRVDLEKDGVAASPPEWRGQQPDHDDDLGH